MLDEFGSCALTLLSEVQDVPSWTTEAFYFYPFCFLTQTLRESPSLFSAAQKIPLLLDGVFVERGGACLHLSLLTRPRYGGFLPMGYS